MPFLLDSTAPITPELICKYIKQHHDATCDRYEKLRNYYEGRHKILDRLPKRPDEPCNNLMSNFAKYITDFASGYLIGEPIAYSSEKDGELDELLDWFKKAQTDVQDMDNAKDQSIYGVAYEMVYMSSDKSPTPKTATINPSQAFVIYNNTVELLPMAGVYYYVRHDPDTQKEIGYTAEVSTAERYLRFNITQEFALDGESQERENPFKAPTLIEIYNNSEKQGDFEQLISLIDGYNMQQSSRVDDVENFVNSIMVLKGQTMGYNDEEKREAYKDIKENGVMELTPESDASFLTRQIDQTGNEVLAEHIAEDIHKFSYVPSLTDKDFASNVSGVAMQFKLLGLNQVTKIKERYTKEGIRERIKLFSAILDAKGKKPVDPEDVTITITHNIPKNLVEIAQVIGSLEGVCSKETLVSQLPFVDDPAAEVEKANEEKKQMMDDAFVMSTAPIKSNDSE